MDCLTLREHVGMLLPSSLTGTEPLEGCSLGTGAVLHPDTQLLLTADWELNLQFLPEARGRPDCVLQRLARLLLVHFADGQASDV